MSDKIVRTAGVQTEVELERDGQRLRSGQHEIEIIAIRGEEIEAIVDGKWHLIPFVISGSTVGFGWDGGLWTADVSDKGARAKARHRDHSTSAPMPGVIAKILVRAGDVVVRGATLLILEAMKMEHPIVAPRAGTVVSVNCREGELIQPGIDLVTLNDPAAEDGGAPEKR